MKLKKGIFIRIIALCISVIPPVLATLLCFPMWLEQGSSKTVSGLCLVMTLLCALPFIRQIKEYFRSPSVVVLWAVLCVIMTLVRNIIDEMLIVSYVALISNSAGALVYKLTALKKEE